MSRMVMPPCSQDEEIDLRRRFDRHHVVVPGHRPERAELPVFQKMHRRLAAHACEVGLPGFFEGKALVAHIEPLQRHAIGIDDGGFGGGGDEAGDHGTPLDAAMTGFPRGGNGFNGLAC
jgi:hypothetical protein